MKTYFTKIQSPLGNITLQANELSLLGIWFETCTTKPLDLGKCDRLHPILHKAVIQLNEYFSGLRTQFARSLVG